ncbi:MAG: hypothetical protein ACI9W2_005101, partial [Gammaproteobacteria bacterium]
VASPGGAGGAGGTSSFGVGGATGAGALLVAAATGSCAVLPVASSGGAGGASRLGVGGATGAGVASDGVPVCAATSGRCATTKLEPEINPPMNTIAASTSPTNAAIHGVAFSMVGVPYGAGVKAWLRATMHVVMHKFTILKFTWK